MAAVPEEADEQLLADKFSKNMIRGWKKEVNEAKSMDALIAGYRAKFAQVDEYGVMQMVGICTHFEQNAPNHSAHAPARRLILEYLKFRIPAAMHDRLTDEAVTQMCAKNRNMMRNGPGQVNH